MSRKDKKYAVKAYDNKIDKQNVFRNIASFKEEASLTDGQIVDRPYRADIRVSNYTKGTALTAQDITATSDTLTVNKIKAALIYVDNVLQSFFTGMKICVFA